MYKLIDRRNTAREIVDELQKLVYGEVSVREDPFMQTFIIHIRQSDIHYVCDISDRLYDIETETDKSKCVNDIFIDYRSMILGKYLV